MRDSYSKQSKKQFLSISLRDLGIDESAAYGLGNAQKYNTLFAQLTTFTPTKQSHLGTKFNVYRKLNNRNVDLFLQRVFSGFGAKNIYLYEVFDTKVTSKVNLFSSVQSDTGPMVCLRCCNGVRDSLYMSVRNAIAHGNIICDGNYYILYSVSDDSKEYDSPITFFMRIKSLKRLETLEKTLELYK